MDVIAWISSYGPWAWVVAGFVLLGIELVAPGGVFVWLGLAAVATGVIALFQPIGWPVQWVLFGVLSVASLVAWLNFNRRRKPEVTDNPFLNQRAQRYVGYVAELEGPIENGFGRVKLGDSIWRVSGPDLPAGTRVRITGHSGATLSVEPAENA